MNEKIRVYIYKYKWLWIANVVLHNWPRTFYYDNNPIEEEYRKKKLKEGIKNE